MEPGRKARYGVDSPATGGRPSMQTHSSHTRSGRGRLISLAAALVATACLCVAVFQSNDAGAVTAQERYDRAQNKLADIALSLIHI